MSDDKWATLLDPKGLGLRGWVRFGGGFKEIRGQANRYHQGMSKWSREKLGLKRKRNAAKDSKFSF